MTTNAPGLSHDQIAELMGISAARVKQIEKRALGKLRRELERCYHVTVDDVKEITSPEGETHDFWA